jgi:agmatinase
MFNETTRQPLVDDFITALKAPGTTVLVARRCFRIEKQPMSSSFAAALIGAPTDVNSSYLRGPAKAPPLIRAALWSESANNASELGPEIGVDLTLDDRGDLPLREASGDDALIAEAVGGVAKQGAAPILLGGDHAVTFPAIGGLAEVTGPLEILHFDAHPDLYDDYEGNPRSHASPFARIMERGLAKRLVQVGIRTLNRHCREQAERFGVEIVTMADFNPDRVPILGSPLYVSIDLDGLDPACAPGVSHHEPGGLSVRQLLDVLHRQRAPLAGADVVELNPDRDLNGMTAMVAAKLVRELCGYGAARRSASALKS